ncbi:CMP/dCMP deaminase zinc-binding protein [Kwoniella heveanensis BCC8398]|uniref:CMP/dCMP deaminase zinc-binding protein n=1 Tax=Kwoniella heveanensis BCC8398 TaxID=1296120 RepID=A0A1B9GQA9_9TREE|nr:CMP/dCMP deaminase zinc-binding protein [Kwoniella heveanensis BCC8398]
MSWTTNQLLDKFLTTTEHDIIPLTAQGVKDGCKVFGAAILRKSDLSLVQASTNDEKTSPLLHGEINCIQQFYAIPAESRPPAKDCIFFSTHEPCSLCLSGITWAGFDNIHFLFTYEDTRDAFAIPHDIKILEEVFKVPATPAASENKQAFDERPLYNRSNAFWTARSVADLLEDVEGDEQRAAYRERVEEIKKRYNSLSEVYQGGKGGAGIPLA